MLLPNRPEFIYSFFGITKIGAVAVPTVSSPRGTGMSLRSNTDNLGYTQAILHSPDTVKTISAGSGQIFLVMMGIASQAVNSGLVVEEVAVSDVNGAPMDFTVTTIPRIYLPIIMRNYSGSSYIQGQHPLLALAW